MPSPRPEKTGWDTMAQDDGVTSRMYRGYPIYQREHLKDGEAPMSEVTRYVSPVII